MAEVACGIVFAITGKFEGARDIDNDDDDDGDNSNCPSAKPGISLIET